MLKQQAQEEGRACKEISSRMKTTRRDKRTSKSARARKAQEYVKRIYVQYIDGYAEKKVKPVNCEDSLFLQSDQLTRAASS